MVGEEIVSKINEFNCNFIEFTGGEPLEQVNIYPLMTLLCDKGYTVAIETGGHINTQFVDKRVIKIIDMKCPDSKMSSLNNYENLHLINAHDEIKFVLASRTDYQWAKQIIEQYQLINKCSAVLFSCVFNQLAFADLAAWILENAITNAQIYLGPHGQRSINTLYKGSIAKVESACNSSKNSTVNVPSADEKQRKSKVCIESTSFADTIASLHADIIPCIRVPF
jgi:7-carboxy-7-deazaguanine synthase